MPFTKRTLSRLDIQRYAECARQLQASGVEIDIPEEWRHSPAPRTTIAIEQATTSDSAIQEYESGTGYMLDLDITNKSGRTMYPVEVNLFLPWVDDFFHWLDVEEVRVRNRNKRDTYYECYRLNARHGIEFPRQEVINHVLLFENAHGLLPWRPVTGKLLARGGPLPIHVKNGLNVPATLTVKCSDESLHSQALYLRVDLMSSRPRPHVRTHDLRGNPLPVPMVYGTTARARLHESGAESHQADQ
jgi:hypothetical protein